MIRNSNSHGDLVEIEAGASTLRSRPYERALFARQFLVTALPVVCYLLRNQYPAVRPIVILAVAGTALNFLYYVLHLKGLFPQSLQWGRLLLDVLLWTILLHYTGGPGSVFFAGFLAEILVTAMALSAAGCLAAAILSSLGFGILVLGQPGLLSWEESLSRLLTLLVAGVLSYLLIRRIEAKWRAESEELRRRLVKAETFGRVGQAAAGMAHEVRNTIHGLRGFLSLLKEDVEANPRDASLVKLIESGVRGMHDATESLLSLSKEEAVERSVVNVGDVIREAIAFATEGGRPPGTIIVLEEEAALYAFGNRESLRGVFVNLIHNAIQAMPERGRLLIRAGRQPPDLMRLDFIDSGPGIPRAIRERIFEPRFTTRPGGTGLGLGLSRSSIERLGGRLTLTGTGAWGTTMTVVLPLQQHSTMEGFTSPADDLSAGSVGSR